MHISSCIDLISKRNHLANDCCFSTKCCRSSNFLHMAIRSCSLPLKGISVPSSCGHWASLDAGVGAKCDGGWFPVHVQTRPACSVWWRSGGGPCQGSFPLGWAHWWSLAAGGSNTPSPHRNGPVYPPAMAYGVWGWRWLEEGEVECNIKQTSRLPVWVNCLWFLTGKGGARRGIEAIAAVSAVTAGDVIVRVFRCREWRVVVHLFISSFEAEGRTCLHGNSVSEDRNRKTLALIRDRENLENLCRTVPVKPNTNKNTRVIGVTSCAVPSVCFSAPSFPLCAPHLTEKSYFEIIKSRQCHHGN